MINQSLVSNGSKTDFRCNHGIKQMLLRSSMSRKAITAGFFAGLFGGLMCASVFAASTPVPGATTVSVSLSGMSIVTKAGATPRVMAAATNLAVFLNKITGATFPITTNGNGTAGIAVGIKGDFPSVSYFQNPPFDGGGTNCTQREDYLLLAHTGANGVYVCGSTDLGVENAVWDFLYRVGYRYYFPDAAWEMIPNKPSLAVDFNVHESPDFLQREIWAQGGCGWPCQSAGVTNYINWGHRNRSVKGVNPNMFGQWGWYSVMGAYPQEFNFSAHPDYFPMHNGVRTDTGIFCPLNPAVEALCASYCTNYFATHPGEDDVSMVAPDIGAGFCDATCPYCGTKSITDRMVLLANYCGVALRNAGAAYKNKRVDILAYSSYTLPPTVTIEPEVIASMCPNYSTGGGKPLSFGDLIYQWNAMRKVPPNPAIGSTMGIYEYYSQYGSGASRPNRPKLVASDFNFVADEIPGLYNHYNIRYMSLESEANFGICGLGYYLASRLLWDTTISATAVRAEFLTNCFGTVACQATMREFYDLISAANCDNAVSDFDTVGRMYALLQTALTQANGNTNVINRINQLVLYTRFCELYDTFEQAAPGAATTNAMAALAPHMYRMKDLGLVHTFNIWYCGLDALLPVGDNRKSEVAEGTNPWKVTTPFAPNEYGAFITNGLVAHPPSPFTPIRYSKDLVKATPLNLSSVPTGYFCSAPGFTGDGTLYTWIEPGSTSVTVYTKDVDNGQMMYLYSSVSSEANLEDRADVVHTAANDTYTPATICEADRVTLGTTKTNLHRLRRIGNYTQITWVDGVPMTIPTWNLSLLWPDSNHLAGANMYFYVPKGKTSIWFTSSGGTQEGRLKDSNGVERYNQYDYPTNNLNALHSIPVPAGQDGKLWKIENWFGKIHFFNIPPYIARNGVELLLPREVVEADSGGVVTNSMTVASTMYAGNPLPVSWTAPVGHSSTDWIAVLDSNNAYVPQRSLYTGTTATSGVITNRAPSIVGNYTVRYFLNDGYTEVTSVRKALTVTAWPGSMTAVPSTVVVDGDVTVNWTAPAGHSYADWIALYDSQGGICDYDYLYTTATSGSGVLTAPTNAGNYTIRWMVDGSYESVSSIPLTVTGQPVDNYSMTVASTIHVGGTLPVSWTAPAGHSATDWITFAYDNDTLVPSRLFYTGAGAYGVATTRAPITAGNYTVRYMLNDGYTEVTSIRKALTVTAWPGSMTAVPSTVAPGGNMTVNWTAPTGHEMLDWIAIYNSQEGICGYANPNTTATSGSAALTAPTAEGNYTIRWMINGSYESVYSIPLTVQNAQNVAPTCSITNPLNGATFSAPASITINATAADSDGSVTKVEFYNGAAKMGEDSSSPYSLVTNNVAAGSYALTVRATDNSGAVTTSAVANVTSVGLPSPWVAQNIGAVGLAGDTIYNSGTFTNKGAGTNIAGTVDAFRYVQQVTSGDCELKLRVASISNTSSRAKAGVMIRGSLTANAMEAGVWVTPSSGIVFTYRTSNGGSTTTSTSSGKVAPYWVRITRGTNSFRAYYSSNGTSWTQLGSTRTISMPASAYMGMGTCSGNTNLLCISVMDNVTATP